MSFDLEFISRNGKPSPTMDALTKWAEETQPNITIESNGENGTLAYENDDTGVYFMLYRSTEVLHLNINYCRPTFFVLETAEVMSILVEEFSLLVNDPNEDTKTDEYDANALINWWKEGNESGCAVLREMRQDFHWMEEAKTTELWHYLRNRSRIVEEYDEYFVPQIHVVLLEDRVMRGAQLTRPTYYVVPPVDVFWLQNGNIVLAERVLSVLKPYLTKVEGFDSLTVVSEDTYFDTDVMDVWESMYDSITPDFNMSQIEGKALAIDGLVDVKLQEKDFKL
jgi:hypothetical protein